MHKHLIHDSQCLKTYSGEDTSDTALFCGNMDNFFDALNVRNTSEGDRKRKQSFKPYRNIDDSRSDLLHNVFFEISIKLERKQ